ncbi:MAG: DUF6220 domain-containing protein, partial [Gaiellaceae bacterium]
MQQAGRAAYRYLVALFLVGVVAQFFLAGLGVFRTQHQASTGTAVTDSRFGDDFSAHVTLGHILLIGGGIVFLAAFAGRLGRRRILLTLALPVLVELQSVFANAGPSAFRALHPVNGTLILGISAVLAHRAWA